MANDLSEKTSFRIKELRIKKGLTMEKLAELIGVSKSTIAKWENGYVDNMRQERVKKLAEIFEVSPTFIMGYDDIPNDAEQTKRFVEYYEKLSPEQRIIVDNLLAALVKKK